MAIGLVCAGAGFSLVTYQYPVTRATIELANRLFGFDFGEAEERRTRRTSVLIGAFLIVAGATILIFRFQIFG